VDLVLPVILLVFFHLRVVRDEEPALRRRFGLRYEEYRGRVPRWFPLRRSTARVVNRLSRPVL